MGAASPCGEEEGVMKLEDEMSGQGFGDILASAVDQAADRLGRALAVYWPCRHHATRTNAVPEQNAVSRLIGAFEDRGYVAWDQVACHAPESRKLVDALLFDPTERIQVLVQAKRLFTRKQEWEHLLADAGSMDAFQPNHHANPDSPLLDARATFGVVVAVTHYKDNAEWWQNGKPDEEDGAWKDFAELLDCRCLGRAAVQLPHLPPERATWLLYGWYRIPSAALKRPESVQA